ncbi:HIT family protein [Ampullimonas aquatilis]|uniref:HIT family protein n=1 Tax=Ampullimonas aquatilis TaxID=1341549 RepID=UPI003C737C99
MADQAVCPLCDELGGIVLWHDDRLRIVRVQDTHFPAFYRIIWQHHVAEMTELNEADRAYLMDMVYRIEQLLRDHLQPTKINLASLGNVVPHLHWHVIARFDWDTHFPNPVWGERLRDATPYKDNLLQNPISLIDQKIAAFSQH